MALGGGGFSEDPQGGALDDYVLDATGRARPRVCFLATAGGDNSSYIVKFYGAFSTRACTPSHLALFNRTVDDARAVLLNQDVIYVGGGNTVNMLAVWRAHGIDGILREAWERGIVLAGLCAGSMCWFEGGVTASFGTRLAPLADGLGLLPGSNCPHYGARREAYTAALRDGLAPGLAAEDGVALHFVRPAPDRRRRLARGSARLPRRRGGRPGDRGAAAAGPARSGHPGRHRARRGGTPGTRRGAVARAASGTANPRRRPTSGGR